MRIDCITTSVNYDDLLRIILPYALPHFDNIYVVTTDDDINTKKCCADFNVMCVQTAAWSYGDGVLNKGRALNEALRLVRSEWVCSLDADIILPPDFSGCLSNLDEETLYSAHRRMCYTKKGYLGWLENGRDMSRFRLHSVPVRETKAGQRSLWGNRNVHTNNSAGVLGYLQLWNRRRHRYQFSTDFNYVDAYDVEFALRWSDNKREWLGKEVLHLGLPKTNWQGRHTERWD